MIYFLSAIITVALDQLTKLFIISRFSQGEPIEIMEGFLRIIYSTNTGGAFGIMKDQRVFLMFTAALLTIAGLALSHKILALKRSYQLGLGLILGGTMGNLIDRIRLGFVVDFIDFSFWPTFNVADIGITVGAVLMIILLLKDDSFKDNPEPASGDRDASLKCPSDKSDKPQDDPSQTMDKMGLPREGGSEIPET